MGGGGGGGWWVRNTENKTQLRPALAGALPELGKKSIIIELALCLPECLGVEGSSELRSISKI